MRLTPEDFPLTIQGNRIYTRRNARFDVLAAVDGELARDIVARLNMAAELDEISRYLARQQEPAQVRTATGELVEH